MIILRRFAVVVGLLLVFAAFGAACYGWVVAGFDLIGWLGDIHDEHGFWGWFLVTLAAWSFALPVFLFLGIGIFAVSGVALIGLLNVWDE